MFAKESESSGFPIKKEPSLNEKFDVNQLQMDSINGFETNISSLLSVDHPRAKIEKCEPDNVCGVNYLKNSAAGVNPLIEELQCDFEAINSVNTISKIKDEKVDVKAETAESNKHSMQIQVYR